MTYPRQLSFRKPQSDPFLGQVIFLANYNTDFVGQIAPSAPTLSVAPPPNINTVIPITGSGSYESTAINSTATYFTNAGFVLNGALTIEFSMEFLVGGARNIFSTDLIDGSYRVSASLVGGGALSFAVRGSTFTTPGGLFSLGVPYHVAFSCGAGLSTYRILINGITSVTGAISAVGGTGVPASFITIGNNASVNGAIATDLLDNWRITKVQRYTTDYTISLPFPTT